MRNNTFPWPTACSASIADGWAATTSAAANACRPRFSRIETVLDAVPGWSDPPPDPRLRPAEVHLWRFCLDAPVPDSAWPALLSRQECWRAVGLLPGRLRRRFLAAHGLLRLLLAVYVETDPRRLDLRHGPRGKPILRLPPGAPPWEFSLSHSGPVMVVAITTGQAVGVDFECRPGLPEEDARLVAETCFAPGERRALQAVPPERRVECFLRLWTAKEACLKATGCGLGNALASFDVAGAGGMLPPRVEVRDATGRPVHCRLAGLPADAEGVGTLAVVTDG